MLALLLCSGTRKNGAEGAFLFVIHFLVTNEHGSDPFLSEGETIGIYLALLPLSALHFFSCTVMQLILCYCCKKGLRRTIKNRVTAMNISLCHFHNVPLRDSYRQEELCRCTVWREAEKMT